MVTDCWMKRALHFCAVTQWQRDRQVGDMVICMYRNMHLPVCQNDLLILCKSSTRLPFRRQCGAGTIHVYDCLIWRTTTAVILLPFSERMESKEEIEVVDETIIPQLIEFLGSKKFSSSIEDFLETNSSKFESLIESKSDDIEWNHEHKLVFDRFQDLADGLFDDFAKSQRVSLHRIQRCCTDVGKFCCSWRVAQLANLAFRVVEGRFAPLFGEDENLWVVEELLSFSDFDSFIKRIVKVVRRSRK